MLVKMHSLQPMKIELTTAQVRHLAHLVSADALLFKALSLEYGYLWMRSRHRLGLRVLIKLAPPQRRRRLVKRKP